MRGMRKRFLPFLLILALLFSGCGNKGAGSVDLQQVYEGFGSRERPFDGHHGPVQRPVGTLRLAQQVPGVQAGIRHAGFFKPCGCMIQQFPVIHVNLHRYARRVMTLAH